MEGGEASGLASDASFAGDANHQLTKIAAREHAYEWTAQGFTTLLSLTPMSF